MPSLMQNQLRHGRRGTQIIDQLDVHPGMLISLDLHRFGEIFNHMGTRRKEIRIDLHRSGPCLNAGINTLWDRWLRQLQKGTADIDKLVTCLLPDSIRQCADLVVGFGPATAMGHDEQSLHNRFPDYSAKGAMRDSRCMNSGAFPGVPKSLPEKMSANFMPGWT